MKAIKTNGFKIDMVDIDYDFLKQQMEEFVKKNKMDKAAALKKFIDALDATGKEITPEVIEEVVNKIIDSDYERINQLKDEIKILDKEAQLLSQYSEREMEDETTTTILTMINNL